MRYINNQLDARAVLNEGFYKVFKNIKSFNQEFPFKPWFKAIMVNTALDYLRKNDKFKYHTPLESGSNISINASAVSNMTFEEMLEVIKKLPIAYRTVFNMYVIDGYKHNEIAKTLGIEIGTSKSNLSRAKEKLRLLLKENLVV